MAPRSTFEFTTRGNVSIFQRVVIGGFFLVLTTPLVAALIESPPVPRPGVSPLRAAKTFLAAVSGKNRVQRQLSRVYGLGKISLLDASPNSSVTLGRGNWLFLADRDVVAAQSLSQDRAAAWVKALSLRAARLRAAGMSYCVMFAPAKDDVYPDQLRFPRRESTPPGQVVASGLQRAGVCAVFPLQALKAAKPTSEVYLRTDSHWSSFGAFVAAQAMAEALELPGWERLPVSELQRRRQRADGGDLAAMLKLRADFPEQYTVFAPPTKLEATQTSLRDAVYHPEPDGDAWTLPFVTTRAGSQRPTAVVIRDSFSTALAPFLALEFSRAVFLQVPYYRPPGSLDRRVLEAERPDWVIQVMADRYLGRAPEDTAAAGADSEGGL